MARNPARLHRRTRELSGSRRVAGEHRPALGMFARIAASVSVSDGAPGMRNQNAGGENQSHRRSDGWKLAAEADPRFGRTGHQSHGLAVISPRTAFFKNEFPASPARRRSWRSADRTLLIGAALQFIGEAWTGALPFAYAGGIAPLELSRTGSEDQLEQVGEVASQSIRAVGAVRRRRRSQR